MSYIRNRLAEGPTWAAIIGFLGIILAELVPDHSTCIKEATAAAVSIALALLPNKFSQ